MVKLPVLWIDKSAIVRLRNCVESFGDSAVVSRISNVARDASAEYIHARRCRTCVSWSADHCYADVPGADELKGSGFCHNHKDAT